MCRSEAAEVGGSARRLAARPRRQDAAQEEEQVQQDEGDVGRSQDGRQDVGEEEEVDDDDDGPFSPAWTTRPPGLALGCRRFPPTRWTCSKLGGSRKWLMKRRQVYLFLVKLKTLLPQLGRSNLSTITDYLQTRERQNFLERVKGRVCDVLFRLGDTSPFKPQLLF